MIKSYYSDNYSLTKLDWSNCKDYFRNFIIKVGIHFSYKKIGNFGMFNNIQVLDLSNNEICKMENLEKLENLTELYLNSNRITKIEKIVSYLLTKFQLTLTKLELSNNKIKEIPKVIIFSIRILEPCNP